MDAVRVADLLFPGIGVEVEDTVLGDSEVRLAVRSTAASAACPGCGWRSSRLHCYYRRRLADRPVAGLRVRLELKARRLVCGNDLCGRRTFAEQIQDLTSRHARRTTALTTQPATTTRYVRRLAAMVRERRSEHLALDVWPADVRLDGQPELRSLAGGI